MWNALWIFFGGELGSLARLGVSGLVANKFGQTFPWSTLIVNVSGSLVIGLFADFQISLVVFVAVTAVILWFIPKWTQYIIVRLEDTADRISDHAHCSVLIVKQPEKAAQ